MQVFKQFAGKRLVLHVHVLCSPHPQSLVQNASTVSYKIKSISDRQTLQPVYQARPTCLPTPEVPAPTCSILASAQQLPRQ